MKVRTAMMFVWMMSSCGHHPEPTARPVAMIDGIALSSRQISELTDLTRQGDAKAALGLAYHYLLVEMDQARAMHWFRVASKLGGKEEKEIYRSFLEEK